MVPWWKRKADLLCAILQLRISCFIMSPGLSGMSSFGTVKRKLLVMPEEALSISVWALSSLCLGIQKKYINKFKKNKKRNRELVYSAVVMLTQELVAEQPEHPWRLNSCFVTRGSGSQLYKTRQSCFSWNWWKYFWFIGMMWKLVWPTNLLTIFSLEEPCWAQA